MVNLLPNYKNATIPDDKIYGYCLNLNHERGRHKARVFKKVFGITANNGEILKRAILQELKSFEVTNKIENIFGTLFTISMTITIFDKTASITTAWIIKTGTNIPKLTTCFVNT
jgi:hypothetical protein